MVPEIEGNITVRPQQGNVVAGDRSKSWVDCCLMDCVFTRFKAPDNTSTNRLLLAIRYTCAPRMPTWREATAGTRLHTRTQRLHNGRTPLFVTCFAGLPGQPPNVGCNLQSIGKDHAESDRWSSDGRASKGRILSIEAPSEPCAQTSVQSRMYISTRSPYHLLLHLISSNFIHSTT